MRSLFQAYLMKKVMLKAAIQSYSVRRSSRGGEKGFTKRRRCKRRQVREISSRPYLIK
jgi:hypothetical protein